jgi:hypothetical protein
MTMAPGLPPNHRLLLAAGRTATRRFGTLNLGVLLLPGAPRPRTVARGDVLFDGGDAITNAPAADRQPLERVIIALAPGGERVR